ncbi:MAG: c-type cytochrome [Myxococcota bacterium]
MNSRALLWGVLLSFSSCADCGNQALQRMLSQPKINAYQPSAFYADQGAMRIPPAGTVAREAFLAPGPVMTGQVDGGEAVTTIPLMVTPELLALGRLRFDVICATCHGVLGDGESLVGKNMALRPPPSLLSLRERPDGHFFRVISSGYGLMPRFDRLSVEERWAVVAYVRALQLSQAAPLAMAPIQVRQKLESAR